MATTAAVRWSEIIDRQEASGLTLGEFSQSNELNRNTLAWWRSRLGRTRKYRRVEPDPTACARFVEFVVAEPELEPETDTVDIVLEDLAARIVVESRTDLGLVRRLLEALC